MTLVLFDVDGTLACSGCVIKSDMIDTLEFLSKKENIVLGLVGGGNIDKIKWQMSNAIQYFKYIFAECGSVIYIDNKLVLEKNMLDSCDRHVLNLIIKKALYMISEMPIIYSGNQIDFRKGLIYISPTGMQATEFERNFFVELDKKKNLRKNLLEQLRLIDKNNMFEIVFGGSVGIAVYPNGWNKSQVIDYLKQINICSDVFYFGDKTEPDGNDYPIYSHKDVHGISVENYHDTITKINEMFLS